MAAPQTDDDLLKQILSATPSAPASAKTTGLSDDDRLLAQVGGVRVKGATTAPASAVPPKPDWIDTATGWLPAVGATAGGLVGSATDLVTGPAGTIGGAALGGAAGEAYKELINRARGRSGPATTAAATEAIGKEGAIQGAAQAVGETVVGPAARAVGGRLMQSAVKPGLKFLTKSGGALPPVVKTLLDEGVNVTPGGVAKLQALVDATNSEIKSALAPSTATIAPLRVASRLNETARTFANQVNPHADLEAISQAGENFLDAHGAPLTVQDAQALKQGTYARIGEKYGQSGAASIEAEKSLARGLKEEIANEVPDVSALNAREGKLLEALHVVGKRVALAGNRDPVGFAWAAHNPTTFLAALIDRNPAVKSLVARGLYNLAGQWAQVAPATIRVAVHALASGDPQAGADAASSDPGHPQ